MANEHIIIWQKWADPFGNEDEIPTSNNIESEDIMQKDNDIYDEYEQNQHNLSNNIIQYQSPIKVMATPMGIIPMNENTASGKIFNFWVGHTNFNLTKKLATTIEHIDGVETLDIFTRYRFRVGIGKAFNDSNVMRDINNTLYDILDNVE
jgi:hypothetical protein